MSRSSTAIAHQFDDIEQQRTASNLGMWIFLATEMMLFGGLFLGYVRYRHAFPDVFSAASRETNFTLGTINTAVLLTSSLTMAMAVHSAQEAKKRALVGFLMATMLLGIVFMGIKGYEYFEDYQKHLVPGLNFAYGDNLRHAAPGLNLAAPEIQQNAALFFVFYFFMTGLHAIHLTIGICLVGIITLLAMFGRFQNERAVPVEIVGLYWHLIDIIWVFLYPLLYLAGRHG